MKKTGLFFAIITLALVAASTTGRAFHEGGVGNCDGCHAMHTTRSGGSPNKYLLQGSDGSSTCLVCHSSSVTGGYAVATYPLPALGTPPAQLTPGGDFAYIQKNYSWITSTGIHQTSPGDRHGHNIVALDYNYYQDATYTTAPGGYYPSANLSCTSCHDPHGDYRITTSGIVGPGSGPTPPIAGSGSYGALPTSTASVGVYRLLGGINYQSASLQGNYAFVNDPFYAVAPVSYNRSEATSDTRVAYGQGVSEWCENCHGSYHMAGSSSTFSHDSDMIFGPTYANNYNTYVMTGDLTGTQATAYSSLTPFQTGNSTDLSSLASIVSSTAGPNSGDIVNCLSCHRAHASAWDEAGRWFFNYTSSTSVLITVNGAYPGTDAPGTGSYGEYATGKTQAEYQQAMYGRPASKFATNQKTLCDKCHVH